MIDVFTMSQDELAASLLTCEVAILACVAIGSALVCYARNGQRRAHRAFMRRMAKRRADYIRMCRAEDAALARKMAESKAELNRILQRVITPR